MKKKPGKIKKSIRVEIALVIAGLVAGTVLLCWLLNATFLEAYYTRNKQRVLMNAFDEIYNADEAGRLTTAAYDVEFENLCAAGNVTVLITSADGMVIRSSAYGVEELQQQFLEIIMGSVDAEDERYNFKRIDASERYVMGQKKDTRLGTDYLILWGQLANGELMLAQTPLESIRESTGIANRLLGYVGVFAILISVLIGSLITKRITTPILQLSDISRRMCELDFEAKYQVRGDDEIQQLGSHMNQLSDTLEHTIAELKRANICLREDIEKKEQADEMRREFLSNVSHELKTPLALIRGYAEGLQECVQDDPQSREFYCEVIIDEADKMNHMVKMLLNLNQLEFGSDVIGMQRFDVTELIRGIVDNSAILFEQNQISVEFDEKPVYVWGDEFKIEEVVTNYLSNAIHHAAGEKRIRIFYTDRQTSLRISVFNTGAPIPEEEIPHIWTKFYKVDKARTREYGGNGIGLSIVKAIMEAHHQAYGVCNHPDGVEFYFELDITAER